MSGDTRDVLVPTRFVVLMNGTDELVIESRPDYTHFGSRNWTVTKKGNGDRVGRSRVKDSDRFWWRPRGMGGSTWFYSPEEALEAARKAY